MSFAQGIYLIAVALLACAMLNWLIRKMDQSTVVSAPEEIADFDRLVKIPLALVKSIAKEVIERKGIPRVAQRDEMSKSSETLLQDTHQDIQAFFRKYRSLSNDNLTQSLDDQVRVSDISNAHVVIGYWITGEPALVERNRERETIFVENWEYSPDGLISPLAPSLDHYVLLVKHYTEDPASPLGVEQVEKV